MKDDLRKIRVRNSENEVNDWKKSYTICKEITKIEGIGRPHEFRSRKDYQADI